MLLDMVLGLEHTDAMFSVLIAAQIVTCDCDSSLIQACTGNPIEHLISVEKKLHVNIFPRGCAKRKGSGKT